MPAVNQSPYINECNYDQAGIILQHIYGALNPPNSGELSGTIKSFSQAKYTDPDEPGALSMGDIGYVFVPRDCEPEQGMTCRVHIALHGCKQDAGDIKTLYVHDAGYMLGPIPIASSFCIRRRLHNRYRGSHH
jgi:hypothetical protein